MPFKSKAQRRLFYAKEERGELPKGTSAKWEAHTPKNKHLPEHVKQAFLMDIKKKLKKGTFLGEMLRTMSIDIPLDIVSTGGGYLLGKKLKFPKAGAALGYLGGYLLPTAINMHRMTKKASSEEFMMKKLAQNLPAQATSRWADFATTRADSLKGVASNYVEKLPPLARGTAKVVGWWNKQSPEQAFFNASANRGFIGALDRSKLRPGLRDSTNRADSLLSTGENMVKSYTDNPSKSPYTAWGIKGFVKQNKEFMDSTVANLGRQEPALYNKMVAKPYNVAYPDRPKQLFPEPATATAVKPETTYVAPKPAAPLPPVTAPIAAPPVAKK